jgi:putative membrane protein
MKTLFAISALALLFGIARVHTESITDAQIASIVVTANQVDIDAGKLARASANADVKKFAQLMIDDHTGVNSRPPNWSPG